MLVNYNTYKRKTFTCKHCGWQGKGTKLSHGAFSELSSIGNLECPKCDELVAYWQAPLTGSSKKKNHPRLSGN